MLQVTDNRWSMVLHLGSWEYGQMDLDIPVSSGTEMKSDPGTKFVSMYSLFGHYWTGMSVEWWQSKTGSSPSKALRNLTCSLFEQRTATKLFTPRTVFIPCTSIYGHEVTCSTLGTWNWILSHPPTISHSTMHVWQSCARISTHVLNYSGSPHCRDIVTVLQHSF
jgi:hypothetical protein